MQDRYALFFNILLMSVVFPAQAEYDQWNGVAFSAQRIKYNLEDPQLIEKSNVYYSQIGTRVEMNEDEGQLISIVNYKLNKCWFVQSSKKIYVELDLDKKAKQCAASDLAGFKPDTRNPGIFFPRPCYGYKNMKALGKDYVVGRRTSKWLCTDGQADTSVYQWYDPTLRMVIREINNMDVTEATHIKLSRKPNMRLLEPPTEYRKRSTKP